MQPCSHFYPLSNATGLDSEGVCLTCGTPWGADDITTTVARFRAMVTTLGVAYIETRCPNTGCGQVRVNPGKVTVLLGDDGNAYTFDCPSCGLTPVKPMTDDQAELLRLAGVRFPLTERDARDFEIQLHAVDCLASTAARELAP